MKPNHFAGPFMGHMYLILVDSHSKWLVVQVMQTITAAKTVNKLRSTFATHELPKSVVSDNGPSFMSEEFKTFMQLNGIRHIKSAPYHPSTNGLTKRAIQTVKQGLRQMDGASVEEKLSKVLHKYRVTPQSTTRISPFEFLWDIYDYALICYNLICQARWKPNSESRNWPTTPLKKIRNSKREMRCMHKISQPQPRNGFQELHTR